MGIIHGEWIHFAFRGKAYHSLIRGAVNTPDLNNSKRRGGWAVSLYVQLIQHKRLQPIGRLAGAFQVVGFDRA